MPFSPFGGYCLRCVKTFFATASTMQVVFPPQLPPPSNERECVESLPAARFQDAFVLLSTPSGCVSSSFCCPWLETTSDAHLPVVSLPAVAQPMTAFAHAYVEYLTARYGPQSQRRTSVAAAYVCVRVGVHMHMSALVCTAAIDYTVVALIALFFTSGFCTVDELASTSALQSTPCAHQAQDT